MSTDSSKLGVSDRWVATIRAAPRDRGDMFEVAEIISTAYEHFYVLVNRRDPIWPGESTPERTFTLLFSVREEGKLGLRVAISARDPNHRTFQTEGVSFTPLIDGGGFLIMGTVRSSYTPDRKDARLFVCRITDLGALVWFKTYAEPDGDSAMGIGITPLSESTPRYMVAARGIDKTRTNFGGYGPAWVFVIDEDGNVVGDGHRYFGLEAVVPTRLRLLQSYGPVLVGTTLKKEWNQDPPPPHKLPGWLLRVSNDGKPVFEKIYEAVPEKPTFPNTHLYFNDIAEGIKSVMIVGNQSYSASPDSGAYLILDGIPGPEGRSGKPLAFLVDRVKGNLPTGISAGPSAASPGRYAIVSRLFGQLLCATEDGKLVWAKYYKSRPGRSDLDCILTKVCWRARGGGVIAGGIVQVKGLSFGAGLIYSDTAIREQAFANCSEQAVHSEPLGIDRPVVPKDPPMRNEPFVVESHDWSASVEFNGEMTIWCSDVPAGSA